MVWNDRIRSAVAGCIRFFVLLWALSSPALAQDGARPALRIGIVPQQSAAILASTWGPLLVKLGAESGLNLEFRTAPNIPIFYERLKAGEYDIAYLNPYQYVASHDLIGMMAFAKEKNRKIQGIIVVKADSPVQNLAELRGAVVAFPSPQSFAASILPRAALRNKGIAFQSKNVGSHESVYLSVAEGLFPAGGGIARTLEGMPDKVRANLRVLWSTEKFTPHALAANPHVLPQHVARLQAAMVAMDSTEDGRALLSAIGFSGIDVAQDADWDDIRRLKISESEAMGD